MQDGVLAKVNLPINKVVTEVNGEGDSYTLSNPLDKEDICDFYPYTFYVLTDGEAPPLCLQPQFMPDIVTVESVVALSHTPLERYYVKGYKGDTYGRIYNVTNSSCLMLPTGKNAGMETIIANANQIQQQRTSMINNVLMSGVNIMGMGMINQMNTSSLNSSGYDLSSYANQSVNSLNTLVSTVDGVKQNMARLKDIELTPSSIASYGTPSSRNQFGNFTVRLIKYTIQDKYKQRIRNFINRYGNKYNNYATINLKNYKGFIKFNSPDIDSKIDNIYINKIREILERGYTLSRHSFEDGAISRFDYLLHEFINLAINRFTWENLPQGLTSEQLEFLLIHHGQLMCFNDKYYGTLILPCMGTSDINVYGLPTEYRVMGENGKYNKTVNIEDGVLIRNNPLGTSDIPTLEIFAKRIDDIEMTQDVNLFQQCIPKVLLADEDSKLTAKNIIDKIRKFKFVIFGKSTLVNNIKTSDVLDTSSPLF